MHLRPLGKKDLVNATIKYVKKCASLLTGTKPYKELYSDKILGKNISHNNGVKKTELELLDQYTDNSITYNIPKG